MTCYWKTIINFKRSYRTSFFLPVLSCFWLPAWTSFPGQVKIHASLTPFFPRTSFLFGLSPICSDSINVYFSGTNRFLLPSFTDWIGYLLPSENKTMINNNWKSFSFVYEVPPQFYIPTFEMCALSLLFCSFYLSPILLLTILFFLILEILCCSFWCFFHRSSECLPKKNCFFYRSIFYGHLLFLFGFYFPSFFCKIVWIVCIL
jgi:hypothetical protein